MQIEAFYQWVSLKIPAVSFQFSLATFSFYMFMKMKGLSFSICNVQLFYLMLMNVARRQYNLQLFFWVKCKGRTKKLVTIGYYDCFMCCWYFCNINRISWRWTNSQLHCFLWKYPVYCKFVISGISLLSTYFHLICNTSLFKI